MAGKKFILAVATAVALMLPGTVRAADINSIADAPVLTPGIGATGQEQPGGWAYYFRVDLQKGQTLTVDLATSQIGNMLCVHTLNPDVTDFTAHNSVTGEVIDREHCTNSQNGKAELKGSVPITGRWTIAVTSCDLSCAGQPAWNFMLTAYVAGGTPNAAPTTTTAICPDYYILDSRGSNEPANQLSPTGAAFTAAWQAKHLNQKIQTWTNYYPAVPLPEAAVSRVTGGTSYQESVSLGEQALKLKIKLFTAGCPKAKLFLTGYSQGAEVTGNVYQDGVGSRVVGVILFGDPKFNSADTWTDQGSFAQSQQRRNGVHRPRPVFKDGPSGKVLSFCVVDDWVCQSGLANVVFHRGQHDLYSGNGYAVEAAEHFAGR